MSDVTAEDDILIAPPRKLKAISVPDRGSILDAVRNPESDAGEAWREKLRRFASLYGRNLRREAERRFGAEAETMLVWIAQCLLLASGASRVRGLASGDPAFLSAAAYCVDAVSPKAGEHDELAKSLSDAVAGHRRWLCEQAPQEAFVRPTGPELEYAEGRWKREAGSCKGVTIIAPTSYSLFSLAVVDILLKLGVKVNAVLVNRITIARVRAEWQRDGSIIVSKIWRKLILRSNESAAKTKFSLRIIFDTLNIRQKNLKSLCADHDIPLLMVEGFGDASVPVASRVRHEVAIFTGGGLLSGRFLNLFPHGVINVHHGHLPGYKGMDVVHAPILEGRYGTVGMTAHFMTAALDDGPVLERCSIDPTGYQGIDESRNALSALMPILAVDAALGYFSGRLPPIEQEHAGRQYYFFHKKLVDALNEVLRSRPQREDEHLDALVTAFEREFRC